MGLDLTGVKPSFVKIDPVYQLAKGSSLKSTAWLKSMKRNQVMKERKQRI